MRYERTGGSQAGRKASSDVYLYLPCILDRHSSHHNERRAPWLHQEKTRNRNAGYYEPGKETKVGERGKPPLTWRLMLQPGKARRPGQRALRNGAQLPVSQAGQASISSYLTMVNHPRDAGKPFSIHFSVILKEALGRSLGNSGLGSWSLAPSFVVPPLVPLHHPGHSQTTPQPFSPHPLRHASARACWTSGKRICWVGCVLLTVLRSSGFSLSRFSNVPLSGFSKPDPVLFLAFCCPSCATPELLLSLWTTEPFVPSKQAPIRTSPVACLPCVFWLHPQSP